MLHRLRRINFQQRQHIFQDLFGADAQGKTGIGQLRIVSLHPTGIVKLVEQGGKLEEPADYIILR